MNKGGNEDPKGAPSRNGVPEDPYRERILAYAIDGVKVRIHAVASRISRQCEGGALTARECIDLVRWLQDLTEELKFLEDLYNETE